MPTRPMKSANRADLNQVPVALWRGILSRVLAGFAGFGSGAVVVYCAVLFGWVAYANVVGYHDFEGAAAMGIVFFFAPLGAVVLGIAGAILLALRTKH